MSKKTNSTEIASAQVRVPATMPQKFRWLEAVLIDDRLSQTAKLVATGLFRYHSQDTGQCNPSQTTLAKIAGTQRQAVNKAVADLVEAGWIRTARTRSSSCYVLNVDRAKGTTPVEMSAVNDNSLAPDVCSGGQQDVRLGVHLDVCLGGHRTTEGTTEENHSVSPPSPSNEGAPTHKTASGRVRQTGRAGRRQDDRTTLPVDWEPDENDKARALDAGVTGREISDVVARFKAHHRGRGTMSPNWPAMWQSWCLGYVDRRKEREARDPERKRSRFQIPRTAPPIAS